MRRRVLPGRGHHGDGSSCHHQIPLEVQRRRREWKAHPTTRGRGERQPLRRFGGEVTGVVCDLCDKKGVPCQWGKVSTPPSYFVCCSTDLLFAEDCTHLGLPGLSTSPGKMPSWRSEDRPVETGEGGGESRGGAQQVDAGEASRPGSCSRCGPPTLPSSRS